jgi:hypothetical protein
VPNLDRDTGLPRLRLAVPGPTPFGHPRGNDRFQFCTHQMLEVHNYRHTAKLYGAMFNFGYRCICPTSAWKREVVAEGEHRTRDEADEADEPRSSHWGTHQFQDRHDENGHLMYLAGMKPRSSSQLPELASHESHVTLVTLTVMTVT